MRSGNRGRINSSAASSNFKMAACDGDSEHSGDSSVLLCIGEPFLGSLTNLDGFGKIRGRCTNPVHNCSCYVRFEHQLSFACLNCQGLCPAFSHALQSHSAQQQVLLHQLRNRLQEYENDQNTEAMSKAHAIEDLHGRLKTNVESIQQLNQQLNSLNKENLRQRHIIDREAAARKSLQLQLESRDQTVMALKAQVESYKFAEVPHRDTDNIMDAYGLNGLNDSAYSSIDKGLQKPAQKDKMRSIMRKEMDKAGVKDPQVLDKSYWIQRVGELSIQLQQSSEYWAQKVRDLTTQMDNEET
ncbi:hypothetical protein OS493_004922 [Desmophyllum pertusum]|uniref:Uncharacterized protein n=1 Tax=Desmophyllum pertusum TaxID=174260 RepID=A0A9W9Z578_9CNID|nr:hypothetical protein OS493_004922 [Desmophyllum pertusum]